MYIVNQILILRFCLELSDIYLTIIIYYFFYLLNTDTFIMRFLSILGINLAVFTFFGLLYLASSSKVKNLNVIFLIRICI